MAIFLTRRHFIGGSAAFAAMPAFPAPPGGRKGKSSAAAAGAELKSIYETADGMATGSIWCRRAYLDIAGRIPTADEAKAFAAGEDPEKREKLVDGLLDSADFADYWAMRYCDVLRVKSEFPVNLWPNAVYVYHRRIRESIERDESWLDFARSLLTAQGSNFRDAETNFLRANANRTPEGLSEGASLAFLGEATPEYAPYFANVLFKSTREWKEEIVCIAPSRPGAPSPADFAARLAGDLRGRFAAAHSARIWQWIFCSAPDSGNAAGLAADFEKSGFRLKPFLRSLVLSPEYARGSVTGGFPVRRLDAEVLEDAICSITGANRQYKSIAPEPFSFLPPDRKSVLIEDGSVSSAFLTLFGRPSRDAGLASERRSDVTAKQRLYLFNSGSLYAGIGRLTGAPRFRNRPFQKSLDAIYWQMLGRAPAESEKRFLVSRLGKKPSGPAKGKLLRDTAWCLLNSAEFLFRV